MKKRISLLIIAFMGTGIAIIEHIILRSKKKEILECKEMSDKHLTLMLLMNQWLKIKQDGRKIEDYFYENEIKTIAIYGMSYAGERLYEELKNTDIEIRYAIDRNCEGIYTDVDVLSMDEEFPEVDAIVVTSVFYFKEIKDMLQEKTDCRIVSLEDVIYK